MSTFFSVPTAAGLAEMAAAQAAQQKVPFTHIALGDGNGNPVDPTGRSALVRQVHLAEISSIRQHPTEPSWVIFEAAVPETAGPFWIRELALIGGRVSMVMGVGNYPAQEQVPGSSGASRGIVVRMVMAYASVATVNMAVSSQVYATAGTLAQLIADHEAKADPHPQYLTAAEGNAAYDAKNTSSAAMTAHAAAADPHPQYLTATEGNAAYDAKNTSSAAMTAHAAAADPHPQYLTAAEGDAAYDAKNTSSAAMTAHAAAADPHPQYLTATEGNAAYDAKNTSSAAMTAHAAAADPHPQYLTAAEGNAAYDPINAASGAMTAHAATADPHPQYQTQAECDARYALLGNLLTADVLKALLGARAKRFFHAANM